MKKIIVIIAFITVLILTGCTNKKQNSDVPTNLKEITGKIVKASLNDDGDIVINKQDISEEVVYISYDYEDVTIGLLAVKDSKGNVKVVINTCQSCGGSPYAYFVQTGNKIQCQNCGNVFNIDDLGNLVEHGCNPIAIESLEETTTEVIVGTEQLKKLKSMFENWEGPKA